MKHPESNLQIACVKWFRFRYREPKYIICTFPNGGSRNIVTAQVLKAEGLRAGMPDLMVITLGKVFFIEMKADKGRQTDSQKEIETILNSMFYEYYVCRSFDEFQYICEKELNYL